MEAGVGKRRVMGNAGKGVNKTQTTDGEGKGWREDGVTGLSSSVILGRMLNHLMAICC